MKSNDDGSNQNSISVIEARLMFTLDRYCKLSPEVYLNQESIQKGLNSGIAAEPTMLKIDGQKINKSRAFLLIHSAEF